jgi:hypothetical protein
MMLIIRKKSGGANGPLVSVDSLYLPAMGAGVLFRDGKAQVTDGPFTESKEVLGG